MVPPNLGCRRTASQYNRNVWHCENKTPAVMTTGEIGQPHLWGTPEGSESCWLYPYPDNGGTPAAVNGFAAHCAATFTARLREPFSAGVWAGISPGRTCAALRSLDHRSNAYSLSSQPFVCNCILYSRKVRVCQSWKMVLREFAWCSSRRCCATQLLCNSATNTTGCSVKLSGKWDSGFQKSVFCPCKNSPRHFCATPDPTCSRGNASGRNIIGVISRKIKRVGNGLGRKQRS